VTQRPSRVGRDAGNEVYQQRISKKKTRRGSPAIADPGVKRVYRFLPKDRVVQGLVKFAGANNATVGLDVASGIDSSRKLRRLVHK
jgi:hypothetical protein